MGVLVRIRVIIGMKLLLFFLGWLGLTFAGAVDLTWGAGDGAAGYIVHYGQSRGVYSAQVDVGNSLRATISDDLLNQSDLTYFAVSCYGSNGLASGLSNEISYVPRGVIIGYFAGLLTPNAASVAPFYHAGAVSLTLSANGDFMGTIRIGKASAATPIAGRFIENRATLQIAGRKGRASVLVLTREGGVLAGNLVEDGIPVSDLVMWGPPVDVANDTTPSSWAGAYTAAMSSVVPPGGAGADASRELGYMVGDVNNAGLLTLNGNIVGGYPISFSSRVLLGGRVPFFALLSDKAGSVGGWLNFRDLPATDIDGVLYWYYPSDPKIAVDLSGSKFAPPTFAYAGGQISLYDGLQVGLFSVDANGVVKDVSGISGLVLSFAPDGLFSGSFLPNRGAVRSFGGAFLQKSGRGKGYISGGKGSEKGGRVIIEPR